MSGVFETCSAELDFQNDTESFLRCITEGLTASSGGDQVCM